MNLYTHHMKNHMSYSTANWKSEKGNQRAEIAIHSSATYHDNRVRYNLNNDIYQSFQVTYSETFRHHAYWLRKSSYQIRAGYGLFNSCAIMMCQTCSLQPYSGRAFRPSDASLCLFSIWGYKSAQGHTISYHNIYRANEITHNGVILYLGSPVLYMRL